LQLDLSKMRAQRYISRHNYKKSVPFLSEKCLYCHRRYSIIAQSPRANVVVFAGSLLFARQQIALKAVKITKSFAIDVLENETNSAHILLPTITVCL
ncbi:Hypothetical predicted protein, partial [Paramuricea clavata]